MGWTKEDLQRYLNKKDVEKRHEAEEKRRAELNALLENPSIAIKETASKKGKSQKHFESELQRQCKAWFDLQYPEYKKLCFAVPNGGRRNAIEAKIMKAEGVEAGVADMLMLIARWGYHGLCIEMKYGKNKQSELQKEWQKLAEGQGYKYVVIYSFDDFRQTIESYLNHR